MIHVCVSHVIPQNQITEGRKLGFLDKLWFPHGVEYADVEAWE